MTIKPSSKSELIFNIVLIGLFFFALFLGLRLVWIYTSLNGDDIAFSKFFHSCPK